MTRNEWPYKLPTSTVDITVLLAPQQDGWQNIVHLLVTAQDGAWEEAFLRVMTAAASWSTLRQDGEAFEVLTETHISILLTWPCSSRTKVLKKTFAWASTDR